MTGGGGPVPHAADQSEKRKPGRTQPTDWPALEAALDANAARIASLNVSVTLAAGKPPTSEELVLAAAAREGLASVVAALPPSLWVTLGSLTTDGVALQLNLERDGAGRAVKGGGGGWSGYRVVGGALATRAPA